MRLALEKYTGTGALPASQEYHNTWDVVDLVNTVERLNDRLWTTGLYYAFARFVRPMPDDQFGKVLIVGPLQTDAKWVELLGRCSGVNHSFNNYGVYSDGVTGDGHTVLFGLNEATLEILPSAYADGDTVGLLMVGNFIQAWKNGQPNGNGVTDSAVTSGTIGGGVFANNSSNRDLLLDFMEAEDLGPKLKPRYNSFPRHRLRRAA